MKSFFILIVLAGGILFACQPTAPAGEPAEATAMTQADSVKKGEYLAMVMGCHDCHTPKIMTAQGPTFDTTRLLSGHPAGTQLPAAPDLSFIGPGQWVLGAQDLTAWMGPWGTSFAANLTPDETGTGNWSFDNFKRALREGKFKGIDGTRPLMPPMPWEVIGKATDEDLSYIWAFLQSLPPIKNVVPDYIPPAGAAPQG